MPDRDAALSEAPKPPRMAPAPESDAAPKAPDKPHRGAAAAKDKSKDDKTLSDLNDGELKGLLDEALNYKNPKDREGKSKLFNNLLNAAEEVERNDRAYRAGGSELVRYYNSSAKRGSRHRKKPSSISENMMHGGSLDNLAKEELFETSKHRTKKSVSARQREGGSLPCNVNASAVTNHEYQFLEEARKKKEMTEKKNDLEAQSLLEHDSLAQTYQEQIEISHLPLQCKYTTKASFQVNVSEYDNNDRNRTVEKKGLYPNTVPVFHVFMSRGGPYSGTGEVDGAIQIPYLESANERKNCTSNKSNTQVVGTDCASALGALRNVNEGKKVDENGNALHQNQIKTKKKKVLTDKNVVVCSAENVEGHRSDIINDMDKLMEFIGITDDQSERNGRPIKSKQLNRHSSEEAAKSSKKRAHSSKGKDGRTKLKKSNSLGEISTTNLEDFEFGEGEVVMRGGKGAAEKPRERRSWGNVEAPGFQALYTNASAENLESAEFRVVTKKKKSKKRRNSVSGRSSKTGTTPTGKNDPRDPSPDLRRKSACSVPHSEKSNDSSDVDSVHSLPIDTQRLDLAASRCLNMPISYADMAKTSDRGQTKRAECVRAVPKEQQQQQQQQQQDSSGDYVNNNNKLLNNSAVESGVKNTPPDVHNIKNFPAITKQVAVQVNVFETCGYNNKVKSCAKVAAKGQSYGRNVKNNVNKMVCVVDGQNNVQNHCGGVHEDGDIPHHHHNYSSSLPPDIPDVQTIEKMQLINQGHPLPTPTSNCHPDSETAAPLKNGGDFGGGNNNTSADCDNDRTTGEARPPVVILSGYGGGKEVPGLVFGFDINEQLLSEDNRDFCCEDFINRYVAPDVYTATSHNHDKIVSFIGAAWEEALVNLSSGKVQYYSDFL